MAQQTGKARPHPASQLVPPPAAQGTPEWLADQQRVREAEALATAKLRPHEIAATIATHVKEVWQHGPDSAHAPVPVQCSWQGGTCKLTTASGQVFRIAIAQEVSGD